MPTVSASTAPRLLRCIQMVAAEGGTDPLEVYDISDDVMPETADTYEAAIALFSRRDIELICVGDPLQAERYCRVSPVLRDLRDLLTTLAEDMR